MAILRAVGLPANNQQANGVTTPTMRANGFNKISGSQLTGCRPFGWIYKRVDHFDSGEMPGTLNPLKTQSIQEVGDYSNDGRHGREDNQGGTTRPFLCHWWYQEGDGKYA